MTEIATIDWFGRWGGVSVFSENTAIFIVVFTSDSLRNFKIRHRYLPTSIRYVVVIPLLCLFGNVKTAV